MVGRTRRALLGAGALAALAAAGCGDRTPAKPLGGDAGVLGTLLAAERALETVWSSAPAAPQRSDVVARLRAHVRALESAGADRDRAAPPAIARAPGLLAAEHAAGTGYLAALPTLRGADARALATGLYAASAQRTTLLLSAAGRDPLPDAFAGTLA